MSIHFISGKPGAGKSLYATQLVLQELQRSRRMILTNLALNVGRVCEYLQKTYGDDFHARERIVILDPNEVGTFWLQTGHQKLTERIEVELSGGKSQKYIDFSKRPAERVKVESVPSASTPEGRQVATWTWERDPGVLYVLDELHEYFDSRRWAETGVDATHYLSQHRKLGDDVICITQSVQNVDKRFRGLAQDFTYVRNHSKESIPFLGGIFRSLDKFSRDTYLEPWTGSQMAIETRWFGLDKDGIASCYATAAGVGVLGSVADVGRKRRGLHPVWVVVALIMGAIALWKVPDMLIAKVVSSSSVQTAAGVNKGPPAGAVAGSPASVVHSAPVSPVAGPPASVVHSAPASLAGPLASPPATNVVCTGFVTIGNEYLIALSDGRVFRTGSKSVRWFGKDRGAFIDGRLYPMSDYAHK